MARQFLVQEHPGNASLGLNAGDIMEEYTKYDYGMKRDHEVITGEEHVNLSYDGDTPFYTVPRSSVILYKE